MKKMIALLIIGMFVVVGCGTVAIGRPDDPIQTNRAPKAPEILEDKSNLQRQEYLCFFYAIDPDGDDVYYDISWKKIDDEALSTCRPDDPIDWLGPFNSGEEVNIIRECTKSGDYELKIRAKDVNGDVGPFTTVSVSYTKAKMLQLPVFDQILARYPGIEYILTKIFKF